MTCGVYQIVCFRNEPITKENIISMLDEQLRFDQTRVYSYIGSSKNIEKRIKQHKNLLNKSKHCNYFMQNSYNKYGSSSFKFIVMLKCHPDNRFKVEQRFINKLAPKLNLTTVVVARLSSYFKKALNKLLADLRKEREEEYRYWELEQAKIQKRIEKEQRKLLIS